MSRASGGATSDLIRPQPKGALAPFAWNLKLTDGFTHSGRHVGGARLCGFSCSSRRGEREAHHEVDSISGFDFLAAAPLSAHGRNQRTQCCRRLGACLCGRGRASGFDLLQGVPSAIDGPVGERLIAVLEVLFVEALSIDDVAQLLLSARLGRCYCWGWIGGHGCWSWLFGGAAVTPLPTHFANADAAPDSFFTHCLYWRCRRLCWPVSTAQFGKCRATSLRHEAAIARHAPCDAVYSYTDQVADAVAGKRQATCVEILRQRIWRRLFLHLILQTQAAAWWTQHQQDEQNPRSALPLQVLREQPSQCQE